MPICSYYQDYELDNAKTVLDKDLNELLQELRAIDDNWFVTERKHYTHRWFRKPTESTHYELLHRLGRGPECQIINFASEGSSINTSPGKSSIMNFIFGYLAGFKQTKD